MDNHTCDETVSPSEMHGRSIMKNDSEASDLILNGAAVAANEIQCEMESSGVSTAVEDKCSVLESVCNVSSSKSESISNEGFSLINTEATISSDLKTVKTDNHETKSEETMIKTEITPISVSADCLNLESSTSSDAVSSANMESSISSLNSGVVLDTDHHSAENNGMNMDLDSEEQNQCHFDPLEDDIGSAKTSLIALDDDEDEEEHHERFLRIDTVEKPLGDGRSEASDKIPALKGHVEKSDDGGCSSSSIPSSSVVPTKNARLVFRNLPMGYTTQQMKDLLQEKLPPGVLLGEFPTIVDGRVEVEVSPSNTAEQAARQLHDIMIGDCKISVRKLITVDTSDPIPTPAPTTVSSDAVQATCDHEGCQSLVMQGDVHTQCCSHSICFSTGVFDPASCPHCLTVHTRASAGEPQAKRLWRNRMQRMRRKRLPWVSEAVRLRFPHPDTSSKINVSADTSLTGSAAAGIQTSSSTTPTDGLTPTDSTAVVKAGDDGAGVGVGRTRDRSAERTLRAQEIAELGSLVVAGKLEMQRRSKGKEHRVTINNIAFGYSLKKMLEMLQDIGGQVSFLTPRFGSLVVEFETAESATACHERLDMTTFMGRKISVALHRDAGKPQQQQQQQQKGAASTPTADDSSSQAVADSSSVPVVQLDGETADATLPVDGVKISAELQARLSTAQSSKVTATGAVTDNVVGQAASTGVKDRLVKPGATTDTFGFSPQVLESLNVTLPLVKELLISNLNERATAADVRELLSVAGCVVGVQYNRAKGTALVEMRHPVEAVQAISLLHTQFYYSKPLKVVLHRPNEIHPDGVTTPPLPKGLQTIGKRLPIDKTLMAALKAGLSTPFQPTKQRPQKTVSIERRLQNNVAAPAKRQQMGMSPAQRRMNGATAAGHQKKSITGQQHNTVMGQQQNISTTIMSNASSGFGGPRSSSVGGGVPQGSSFPPQKHEHTHGTDGQNNSVGGDKWSMKSKRGGRRPKRPAGSDSDFGNPAKRTNPYWGNYRGSSSTGNNPNSLAGDSSIQNSNQHSGQGSGSKISSNYGHGNNNGNSNSYSTLNRYTGCTPSTITMGSQYSAGSSSSTDWNTNNSSSWNDNYNSWNWQQQSGGDTSAYGGNSTATVGYGGTAPTGYSENTSASGFGATNAPYGTGAVRSYNNSANNNMGTTSYGSSTSSTPAAGYGTSVGPVTASYSNSVGVDGSGAYAGSSYYNSSGAPETVGSAGAHSTAWEGQPTAKVPKYNNDGSFAGFS